MTLKNIFVATVLFFVSASPAVLFATYQVERVRAPSSLTATSRNREVVLRWHDNSNNESGFWIRRTSSAYGDTDGDGDFIGKVPANTTMFVDMTAKPGRTYYYRVRVSSVSGFPTTRSYSIWSNQISYKIR